MSDIGIEGFPKEDKSCDAAETFKKALKGKTIPENEFRNFLFESMCIWRTNTRRIM